jgi:hypothetical protein
MWITVVTIAGLYFQGIPGHTTFSRQYRVSLYLKDLPVWFIFSRFTCA